MLLRQCLTDCLGLTIEPSVLLPQPPEGWGCKHGGRKCLVMLSSGGRWHLWGRETPSPSGLSQSHLGCETVHSRGPAGEIFGATVVDSRVWIEEVRACTIRQWALVCSPDSEFNLCRTDTGGWTCLLIRQQQCH